MSDLQFIKNIQIEASKKTRGLKSLEEVATELHITSEQDPMLYLMYRCINKDKLTDYELNEINETIRLLNLNHRQNDEFNLNVCINSM